mgnify:FL=1
MFGQSLLSAFGSAACTTDDSNYPIANIAYYKMSDASDSATHAEFATWDPNLVPTPNLYNGNLRMYGGSTANGIGYSNQSVSSGKHYWEHTVTAIGGESSFGIARPSDTGGSHYVVGTTSTSWGLYVNGNIYHNGVNLGAYMSGGFSNGDIIGAELDLDNGTLKFYKNGTGYGNAFTGLTGTFLVAAEWRSTGGGNDHITNFGASSWAYNPSTGFVGVSELASYNGTATNVNFNTEGKFGFAGAFNGSSSRITLPKLTGLVADVTVSGWVNLGNTTTANRIRFVELNTNANGYAGTISAYYRPSDGQWLARSGNGTSSNSDVLTHVYQLTQSTWYNVCFTRDNSTNVTKFYVNGLLQDTETVSVSSSYPSNATGVIGDLNYTAGLNYNWLGSIDQIRIYDSAISAANVTTLYNEIECPAVAVTNAFNTVLYTGNGSTQPISTVGFQPDLVFLHWRNTGNARNPIIFDSVRGVTKYLKTNTNEVQATLSTTLTSFNINGFSIGSSAAVNENNSNWVAWNWKAGGNSNTFNIDGTGYSTASAAGLDGGNINPTGASINKASGFGIYTASPTTASQSISHGLDSAPEMYIFKTTNVTRDWYVSVNVGGTWKFGTLNTTAALSTTTAYTANSNTMVIGGGSSVNEVVYAFTSVPGYSRIGSYVGNGSATGPVVYLGFEPAFVMIKKTDATGAWSMFDNKRDPSNPVQKVLQAQSNAAEANVGNACNFNSNNFQLTDTNSQRNANGGTYIFIAIA